MMLWFTLLLALAFVAVLVWAIGLRRRLGQAQTSRLLTLPIEADEAPPSTQHDFPALFYAAAAALDDGLVAVNTDRLVRFLNPQAEELLAMDSATAIGQGLIALIRDYQADLLVRDVLGDGEVRETTMQPVLSGRTLRLRCTPLQIAGTISGALLFIRDVTQINRLERARRDLVANVSHELRTPLASLKLLVETLQSEPPPSIAQRMLGQVAQEVDAVTQLVDELHELSQIESGRVSLQLSPAPIQDAVERALARIRPQGERKSLRITSTIPDTLPLVLMDANRIGQVLLNLLHNAVKFTPEGGTIEVHVCLATVEAQSPRTLFLARPHGGAPEPASTNSDERFPTSIATLDKTGRLVIEAPVPLPSGTWLLVAVADSGIGIASTEVQRIFERFYKVDRARTRNQGGTGLGLAIGKHLVEGHGGNLWAASVEGKGSTFYFTLSVVDP